MVTGKEEASETAAEGGDPQERRLNITSYVLLEARPIYD
jgi:hypothetical protein